MEMERIAVRTRIECDALGEKEIPRDALWGIHTARALENFPLAGRPLHLL
jgi:aspartate ammonia-lyase